jgi:hypothetical protein
MLRLILILGVWLAVIVVVATQMDAAIHKHKTGITAEDKQRFAKQVALLSTVERQYQQQHYPVALQMLENGQSLFAEPHVPEQLALGYYLLKGKVHWSLWEYVEADQAWQTAERYAKTSAQKGMLTQLTRDSQRVVHDINRERNHRDVYLASPHVGPASELKGKVALIYVFLVDSSGNSWSLRDRSYVENTWHQAQAWLQEKARRYGSQVSFSQRLFLVDKNPRIARLRVGDVSNQFKHVDQVAMLAAKQLGFPSVLAFTDHINQEEHADQAMLLFHLARDGRSFASRCLRRCSNLGEFVVLLESARSKKWQSLQYAQAHESLHLFGADDLYNIRNAKYYEVRDIMNYPSSQLQASTLEALTAWSVGLDARKPDAPFKIKTLN